MKPPETDEPPRTDGAPPGSAAAPGDAVPPFAAAGRALDAAGVGWCRIRDREGGAEDDLLVARDDLGAASRALADAGWRPRRHLGHGTHLAFHAFDRDTDRWWKMDVVTALDYGRWQEWESGLAAGCLARARTGADGPVLAADDAFWTLLLHELLDRPAGPVRRGVRLRELAAVARVDGPGAQAVTTLAGASWSAAAVIAAVAAEDASGLAALGRSMRASLRRRPSAIRRRLMSRVLRRLDHLDPPFIREGRTVALLGPDGAGKSSLAMRVGRGAPMARRSVYMGLYGGSRGGRHGRRVPGLGFVRRLVAMWRGWLVGWWHASRGRLVIFDRHPYDARLGSTSTGTAGSGWIRRAILGHAVPAPDVVIVLDAPADLLYARKPEHPVERIEQQRQRYRALSERLDQAVLVDASAPLEDVARAITGIAWEGLPRNARAR